MNAKIAFSLLGLFLYLGILPVAEAHVAEAGAGGLMAGLAHPFLGPDHLFAMIAVGIWAGQLARFVWLPPLTFLSVMVIGAALAGAGLSLPMLEPAIASSLLVLGLIIAGSVRLPVIAMLGIIGSFALFHGAAHGMALPQTASPIVYGMGFVLATALLLAVGIGFAIGSRRYEWTQRVMGYSLMVFGVWLLVP